MEKPSAILSGPIGYPRWKDLVMDLTDRTRRWVDSAVTKVGVGLTTTRGRILLWVLVLVLASSLPETGLPRLGVAGTRMAAAMLVVIPLELAAAALVWLWRRRPTARSGR